MDLKPWGSRQSIYFHLSSYCFTNNESDDENNDESDDKNNDESND
ncbi:12390_t:CDS:2 [Cetraspora pellucida]|uniref:12390_t:CDS:1 n=1 Tax=Cetraspora pellucida TaxID=1433469 RepID=A0ACA9KD89_9GLOM|nr:12390_t:CDS:2 [Cetraspora pellucida]